MPRRENVNTYASLALVAACLFLYIARTICGDGHGKMFQYILVSFVTYHLLYTLLCLFPTCLQPRAYIFTRPGCRTTPAEWRDKVLSTVNAVVQIVGGVQCYLEWDLFKPESSAWTDGSKERYQQITFVQYTGCALMGYLIWDLSWMIWHYNETPDKESICHHVLFLLVAYYNMYGFYFSKCFAWMACAEISTIFLNFRWFLLTLNQKSTVAYTANSVLFCLTFLLTRIVVGGWGLYDVWKNKMYWEDGSFGVHGVVFGLHLIFLMNLFWSQKVVSGFVAGIRALLESDEKKNA
jgi:hypothetical protein